MVARVAVALPQLLPRLEERRPIRSFLHIVNVLVDHLHEVLRHRKLLVYFLCFLCGVHGPHLPRLQQLSVELLDVFTFPFLGKDLALEPLALLVGLRLLVIQHLDHVLLAVDLAWQHAALQLLRELFLVFVQHFLNIELI